MGAVGTALRSRPHLVVFKSGTFAEKRPYHFRFMPVGCPYRKSLGTRTMSRGEKERLAAPHVIRTSEKRNSLHVRLQRFSFGSTNRAVNCKASASLAFHLLASGS